MPPPQPTEAEKMNRYHRWYCRSKRWHDEVSEAVPWVLEDVDPGDDLLEVGPGPGLTTDLLRKQIGQMTCIEVDPKLAAALTARMDGSNVRVFEGDASQMPFEDGAFSGAVCFTMLHHVPSAALQDRLLAEVFRVLRPGAVFAGLDSTWSPFFQLIHLFDTMVLVDPDGFAARLEAVGFRDIMVERGDGEFRFRARRPGADAMS